MTHSSHLHLLTSSIQICSSLSPLYLSIKSISIPPSCFLILCLLVSFKYHVCFELLSNASFTFGFPRLIGFLLNPGGGDVSPLCVMSSDAFLFDVNASQPQEVHSLVLLLTTQT